jgi:succinoglycan biosynthesis protein ExoW
MDKISVIVPFFQREPGILTRALNSIKSQHVPDDWVVEVIIIDDASPCPAHDDVHDMTFTEPLHLKVIRQENGGVGAARNRGLEEADKSATLIAFLDSDDIWPANHLARAIQASDKGFDFYFTDNCREGHHESHCRSPYVAETAALLEASPQKTGFLEIPTDHMIGLTLFEFPSQASTVVYRRSINKALHFDTELQYSGEDVLFFTKLVASANRVCFDLDSIVECGGGVNIYFSNLSWSSERFLAIKVDKLITHRLIAERLDLSSRNKEWNDEVLAESRKELAFQMLRNLMKNPMRALREIKRLARIAPGAVIVLPIDIIGVLLVKVIKGNEGKKQELRS